MPIKSLYLENFRLFKSKKINLSGDKTLILGKNGSGKTTILECFEILFSGKSFRSKNSIECIAYGEDFFKVDALGHLAGEELRLSVSKTSTGRIAAKRLLALKKIKTNEVPLFQVVLAKHLRMVEGEPELRRDFMNRLMFHVKPDVNKIFTGYQKALSQRNRALRKKLPAAEIQTWTERLVDLGMLLSKEQHDFFRAFKEVSLSYVEGECKNEGLDYLRGVDLHFVSGWETSKTMKKAYQDSLPKDMALGYTSQGPHKQDFVFSVDKKRAASQLSRGQLKMLILLIFLSTNDVINSFSPSESVLMVDDVTSELDEGNIDVILSVISRANSQVLITAIKGSYLDGTSKNLTEFKKINL